MRDGDVEDGLSHGPMPVAGEAQGPPAEPDGQQAPRRAPATLVYPSRTDPLVRAASAVIGGPAGRRMTAGGARFGPGGGLLWITAVLTLLSGVTLAVGLLQKQPCRASGWNSPDQFWHACYSDIAVLYTSQGLGGADPPTLMTAVGGKGLGQPPLAAAVMWLVSRLVHGHGSAAARQYFDLSAVLLAAALAVAVAAVAAAAGRRPWDAAHVALTPVLVTAGLISYDLLAVALLAVALLAWSRRRLVIGGVLLGLAMATRPVLAAVLVAVLTLSARTGRPRPLLRFILPALAAWLAVRLVLIPGTTGGLGEAYQTWRLASPGYGSVWLVPSLIQQAAPGSLAGVPVVGPMLKAGGLSASGSTLAVLLCLVLVLLATLVLGLSTADRPRLAHLALFAVAGSLIVAKAVPVQAGLVLLPLIALAGLRWRDHLIWATTELVYFVGVWLYIAASSDPNKGLPAGLYLLLLLARLAGIGWLMVQVVRAMRTPALDPVRVPPDGSAGSDDPLGGELAGSPDALVVRLV